MDITPIRGEADYERALHRVEELWDSREGSAESDELDILTTLLEAYEREHYPVDLPDPVEAIKFRLERSEEHTSELQSRLHLVCRLLLEKKNKHEIHPLHE